ncbi:methylthioribulose 1-phosphate dehydratase [Geitlerinema sp. PCC 7407]|uniref:methylthioribulose 1-phosphate dehydratase n=1 Tax=Geitlerinema sp. PCC 7407 TaxID=1173025 RepID=UPI00029FD61E|nr:methylthioribulose 1-phosphate dehydratase [Geitlerinema sp. PCC 7407]AFY65120.1 methylthioribulose-1-phosphate dehydratase [Geitlerinema sp. PCC 7407]
MSADPRSILVADARRFYEQGWMVGTAGNLSARQPDGSFWITASGRDKGQLSTEDFIRIAPDGSVAEQPHPTARPSNETCIHEAIYQLFPEAQACYHVHSVPANLVSRLTTGDRIALPPLEMIKGLGIWEENPTVHLPILANHLQVPRIAAEIRDRFSQEAPEVPALLIRDHGITIWAPAIAAARHYVEVMEYIFRFQVAAQQTPGLVW